MSTTLINRRTSIDATCAFVGGLLMLVNYGVYAMAAIVGAFDGRVGGWKIASASVGLVAAFTYTKIFLKAQPTLSAVFLLLTVLATALYIHELFLYGIHVGDLPTEVLPLRYSQIAYPLSYLVLGIISWRDERVPPALAYGLWALTVVWLTSVLVNGQIDLQVVLALVLDVTSFLAFTILIFWLFLYGYSEWQGIDEN